MADAANTENTGPTSDASHMRNTQETTGDPSNASAACTDAAQNDAQPPDWSIDVAPNDPLTGLQGSTAAGAQPNVAGADQPTAIFPRRNPQPGEADDPQGTNLIPPPATGEQQWVDAQFGTAPEPGTPLSQDANQYTNPQYAGIQGNMMGASTTIQGAPFEQGVPGRPDNLTPGNEGFVEGGNEGPPTEEYGQGETRQFAPGGAEQGIEQQDQLQSQQYEREEKQSRKGLLGVAGDMLGALFGNPKRTPVPPPADEDEGEAAGEAHP